MVRTPALRSTAIIFFCLLLAGVLPLVLFVYLSPTNEGSRVQSEANQLALELDRSLQLRMKEVLTIAAFPSLRAFAASDPATRAQRATVANNEIQAWVAVDPPVREVFVLDKQGQMMLTTGNDWNKSWSSRAFVASALAGRVDVSPPSRDAGEYSQYYAAPILDNRREIAGALVARVEAQEIWGAVWGTTEHYSMLVDENGVRLADGGDPARRMTALAPLLSEAQTRVVNEQTYGSQIALVRATDWTNAARAVQDGTLESVRPADFGASDLGEARLKTKPWTVFVVQVASSPLDTLSRMALPLAATLAVAALGAYLLAR